jgi:hypothetical protein
MPTDGTGRASAPFVVASCRRIVSTASDAGLSKARRAVAF